VVIDGKRILTNAHVVSYASEVQVQGSQGGDRITAKVAFFAPGIDLAVLTLEDDAFFRTHRPIARATALPTTKDTVLVYGYPTGGQTLSVTKGIVSRIEFAPYNFPASGLRVQIDAAINPGNSGGPAVVGDKMVGIAFSRLKNAENIGYIIPNEEIELFLADIADGHYDGKPMLFEDYQTLENPALRAYLKLPPGARGVVVQRGTVDDGDSPLHRWDLITHIASTPISDQGEINLGGDVRVRFPYLVQRAGMKGEVPFSIIRDGRAMNVTIPVHTDRPMLIPTLHGQYPPYFIYGPLVFSVATQEFVSAMLGHAELVQGLTALRSPLVTERLAKPDAAHEELVIIASPLFPHPIAKGYGSHAGVVVAAVNGRPIRSLRHLVGVLRDLKDELVVFEFAGRGGEALVFPRKDMVAATEAVLTDNGIREQASADLLAIWKGTGT
jgi:S1-C subfamily serine protease